VGKRIVREIEIPQLLLVPGPKILKAKVSGGRLVGWDLRGNGGNGDGSFLAEGK
jgi:hypothetical protein